MTTMAKKNKTIAATTNAAIDIGVNVTALIG